MWAGFVAGELCTTIPCLRSSGGVGGERRLGEGRGEKFYIKKKKSLYIHFAVFPLDLL